jgi:hypothetical protein
MAKKTPRKKKIRSPKSDKPGLVIAISFESAPQPVPVVLPFKRR